MRIIFINLFSSAVLYTGLSSCKTYSALSKCLQDRASRKHSSHFNQRWASEFWFLNPLHENNHLLHLRHCTVNYFIFVFSSGWVTSSSPLQRPTNILLYVTNLHRVRCGFLSCGDHRTHARANAKGCKSIEYCYRVLHVNTSNCNTPVSC